jgi:hypothetical protein
MFRKALKIKQIQGAPTRSQASTINNIGIALQNKGCFDEAI